MLARRTMLVPRALLSAAVLGFAMPAAGAVITPISAAHLSADFGTSATNLINGNGLSGYGPVLSQMHNGTTFDANHFWLSANFANTLTFTLPGPSTVSGVHIWQYDQGACCTGRGVSSFNVSFSTDGGVTFPTTISGITLNQAIGADESVQTRTFATQTGVTHVRFSNMTDFPAGPSPGYLGLAEVRFEGSTVLPPPPVITGGTGPGGFLAVGPSSDMTLWLKGDAGVTKDGSDRVSVWADQSGRANHVTQSTLGRQPLQNASQNGIPMVTFDGGAAAEPDEMISSSAVLARTIFLVDLSLSQGLECCNPAVGNQTSFLSIRRDITGDVFRHPGDGNDFTNPAGSVMLINGVLGNAAPLNQAQILEALRGGVGPFNFTNLKLAQHTGFTNRAWNGRLGEVLVLNRGLTVSEQRIMENYFSSKYDIPLNTAGGALDLYAGDTPANGNYDYDVFGIGRVDESDQVRSAGSQGLGILSASLGDGQWVLAGHKTPVNSLTGADMPGSFRRWERVWYVDATGPVGAALTFDFSDGGLGAPPGGPYALLYSPTSTFSFQFLTGPTSVAGDQVSFQLGAGVLRDGYYTLGIVPEPSSLVMALLGGLFVAGCVRRRHSGRPTR